MKKRLIRAMVIFLIVTVTLINLVIWLDKAVADSDGYFILCNPQSVLNARFSPNKHGSLIGTLMCGDYVTTDGKKRNGFVHCTNLTFETDEGWVSKGYLVEDEPLIADMKATVTANGRVACRNKVGGDRVRWIKPGQEITVFAYTEQWCVTNQGYIQTKYLEISTTAEE